MARREGSYEKIGERIGELAAAGVGAMGEIGKSPGVGTAVKTMGNVAEAVGPFLPLVAVVATLAKDIVEAYENVQYNKKTCSALVNRVEAADVAIKALMRQKEDNIDNFRSQDYYDSFSRFVNCLKQIKKFFDDISQLSKFKKFVSSGNIRDHCERIIGEFNSCSGDLNLAISIATSEQMKRDLTILHDDMFEMTKFLNKIEGGITTAATNTEDIKKNLEIQNQSIKFIVENIEEQNKKIVELNELILSDKKENKSIKFSTLNREIDTISLLHKQVNEANSTIEVKARRIEPSDLEEPIKPDIRQGARVKIQKKRYQAMDVACKSITMDNNNIQIFQKHLAILGKLGACPYIIQFHGLSEIHELNVMVFEWAELGTLREVYQSYKIDWEAKISIARDICRGLAFLHTVKILHHDVRCENVLITEKIQPKLCNFKFAREFHAATSPIDNINAMIHWLAPEKLSHITTEQDLKRTNKKQDEARYTIQCEIFSFGMLLWELGFQKKPYENMSMLDVQKHVSKGQRENLELSPNPLQKGYYDIVKLAWQQEPSLRPGIQPLFNMLQDLYETYILNKGSPLIRPIEPEFKDEGLDELSIPDTDISVTPLLPVKEGLRAHKEGDYKKAWECFEGNAKVGDTLAKYWQGYYYLEGKYQQKDKKRAMELFKEAAEAGNADAQLRYAFCLIDKENNHIDSSKFMKYLQLAADNNNATALYNLGDVYFSGKLGIKKDREKGVHYLKQAALNNQSKALEILKKNNISLYG